MRKIIYSLCLLMCASTLNAMEEESKLAPAFYAKRPEKIKYCKGTPLSAEQIEEIPLDQFCEKHDFEWTEALVVDPTIRRLIWADKQYSKDAPTLIEERLHNPLTCLVICKIDNKVGMGVFLALDAEPLPPGTIIALYAGNLCDSSTPRVDRDYIMSAREAEHQASAAQKFINQPCVDACDFGNITRFFQDLPSDEKDLKNITNCSKLQKNNIATENCGTMAAIYKGFPISYVVTVRKIEPGEQLGWPYENNYWQREDIERAVFDRSGNVIGHFVEQNRIRFVKSFKATKEKRAVRVKVAEVQQILQPLLTSPDINGFDHRKRFIEDVLCCFSVYENEAPDFIAQLQKEFVEANTTDDKFLVLKRADYPTDLGFMKTEIIRHMTAYNAGQKLKNK